ncbi:hypothetical protein COT42_08685 [Candidatus Saganbacteria bacterium CG08_land_8_20_14_0_20_45_16]|uniref:PorV/PorQ family protein n=1 Tax=Candidatus Saganbacteria bacterium CG08_land_8_20_14_0_20_45_16 TaxID=2014293 RepID=A0A2H0XTI3_UNCSA|nr:MAG: hypothetical protein COT42_08685 [Candidatus Saganbacteria bacterium CG08_land_8_20_14_0_20_45_16]
MTNGKGLYQRWTNLWVIIFNLTLFLNPALAHTAFDPMTIGVGARALGMGKAYVAVAEGGDALFTNPAGLGETDSFKFTSMSSRLLEDVNYTLLGAIYPMGEKSAVGLGYITTIVSGIELRNLAGTLLGRSNFSSNVLFASYGKKLTEKLSLGFSLKYFSQNGSENNTGNSNCLNLDVGILQRGLDWLSLGVVGHNLLGGEKFTYASGAPDSLPMTLTLGTKVFLLGEKYQSAFVFPAQLSLQADAILPLNEQQAQATNWGVEFSPNQYLTLRTGLDQANKPEGIDNNLTYGLSLHVAGIGFHYAYHAYSDLAANATQFFSLSFDERGWPSEEFSPPLANVRGL